MIAHKKKIFLLVGILSFLCLIGAIIFIINYDYYPIDSRIDEMEKYSKENDNEHYETNGWIRVQGTNIDYPVLYAPRYKLDSKTDDFAWNEVNPDHLLNKMTINGHNILNLSIRPLVADPTHSRFEQLLSFVYLQFVEENKYIQFTYDGEDYLYKIFSVSIPVHGETNAFLEDDLSKDELNNYIEQSLEDSIFKFNIDVNENDKILSLLTCTRMYDTISTDRYDFRVDARLVRKGELTTNYGVKKSGKYKKIDEIMKGGEEDDEA